MHRCHALVLLRLIPPIDCLHEGHDECRMRIGGWRLKHRALMMQHLVAFEEQNVRYIGYLGSH